MVGDQQKWAECREDYMYLLKIISDTTNTTAANTAGLIMKGVSIEIVRRSETESAYHQEQDGHHGIHCLVGWQFFLWQCTDVPINGGWIGIDWHSAHVAGNRLLDPRVIMTDTPKHRRTLICVAPICTINRTLAITQHSDYSLGACARTMDQRSSLLI